MAETFAIGRLQSEFRELVQNEDSGFSVGLENDNWFLWSVCFTGPTDTPFEGGFYMATMKFPIDYPNNPPEMRFRTEMWHPNSKIQTVFPDGRVCISILHPPGEDQFNSQETSAERWRPILGVEAILHSVISMLNDPNINSPANLDSAVMNI